MREIATVLDLRFADGTVVRVRQQGANFDETWARFIETERTRSSETTHVLDQIK